MCPLQQKQTALNLAQRSPEAFFRNCQVTRKNGV